MSLPPKDVGFLEGWGAVCVWVCARACRGVCSEGMSRERSWRVPNEFAYDLHMTFTLALGGEPLGSICRIYILTLGVRTWKGKNLSRIHIRPRNLERL